MKKHSNITKIFNESYIPTNEDSIVQPSNQKDTVQIDSGLRLDTKEKELFEIFLEFVQDHLGIENIPNLHILNKRHQGMTYGAFNPNDNSVMVYGRNRGLADIMRTTAHELVHFKQKLENRIPKNLQSRDHKLESEANTIAGDIVYMFGLQHPEIYDLGDAEENIVEIPKN